VGEIYRKVCGEGDGGVVEHLSSLIPGQRFAQVRGQVLVGAEQGVLDRVGVIAVRHGDRAQVVVLAICSGGQPFLRPSATRSRSSGSAPTLRSFGRLRDSLAAVSASYARYASRRPCHAISQEKSIPPRGPR